MCADLSVAICFDDTGSKEGVAVCGDDEAEVHESAEDEFEIFETVYYVGKGDSAFARGAALVFEEAGANVGTFVFAEPAGFGISRVGDRKSREELTISLPLGSLES